MKKETVEALKKSIEHWKRLYTGTAAAGEDTGTPCCALCSLFYYGNENCCTGCPIAIKTGQTQCDGSPYVSSVDYGLIFGKSHPDFQRKAKVFHDFLVGLLPKPNYIGGRQYGRRSEANRAIRNYCKATGENADDWYVNQLDYGCYEICGDLMERE